MWKSIKDTEYLIKLHDTWFEKGKVIFVTELMDCGNIKQFLKVHGLQRKGTIKKWAKQILKGLKALHDEGIAHRDIKTENIYINSDGNAKVGDFGLASDEDMLKSLVGSPAYIAPEIFSKGYDKKCDVYSFGILLIELITNATPYKECANLDSMMDFKKDIKLPQSIYEICDHDLFGLICICLIPDSDFRPSVNDLLNDSVFDKKPDDNVLVNIDDNPIFNYNHIIQLWRDYN